MTSFEAKFGYSRKTLEGLASSNVFERFDEAINARCPRETLGTDGFGEAVIRSATPSPQGEDRQPDELFFAEVVRLVQIAASHVLRLEHHEENFHNIVSDAADARIQATLLSVQDMYNACRMFLKAHHDRHVERMIVSAHAMGLAYGRLPFYAEFQFDAEVGRQNPMRSGEANRKRWGDRHEVNSRRFAALQAYMNENPDRYSKHDPPQPDRQAFRAVARREGLRKEHSFKAIERSYREFVKGRSSGAPPNSHASDESERDAPQERPR